MLMCKNVGVLKKSKASVIYIYKIDIHIITTFITSYLDANLQFEYLITFHQILIVGLHINWHPKRYVVTKQLQILFWEISINIYLKSWNFSFFLKQFFIFSKTIFIELEFHVCRDAFRSLAQSMIGSKPKRPSTMNL